MSMDAFPLAIWGLMAIFISFISYDVWMKPDDFWKKFRGRVVRGRAAARRSWLKINWYADPFGFENNKQAYILVIRIVFCLVYLMMLLPFIVFLLAAFGCVTTGRPLGIYCASL